MVSVAGVLVAFKLAESHDEPVCTAVVALTEIGLPVLLIGTVVVEDSEPPDCPANVTKADVTFSSGFDETFSVTGIDFGLFASPVPVIVTEPV